MPWPKGRKHTAETKGRIRESVSKSRTGRTHSPETKRKIGDSVRRARKRR